MMYSIFFPKNLRPALAATAAALALLAIRFAFTGHFFFKFLIINLFLAWMPWFITRLFPEKPAARWKEYALGGLWLVFLPNAPYVFTDFVHFKARVDFPWWADLMLLLFMAWAAWLAGMASWQFVRQRFSPLLGQGLLRTADVILPFLWAFGVYIGRFYRFNSWEVFTQPAQLGYRLAAQLSETAEWGSITAFVLGFGLLIHLLLRTAQPQTE